jgi:hypothetical protein
VPPDGATTEGMQTTPERAPTDVQEPAPAAERAPDAAPAVDAGNAGAAGAPASRTAARRPKVPQPPRRTGSRDATRREATPINGLLRSRTCRRRASRHRRHGPR